MLAPESAWTVFAPDRGPIEPAQFVAWARTFLGVEIEVVERTRGVDHVSLQFMHAGVPVTVTTFPLAEAPALREFAEQAAAETGGGFDALIARATRVWQVDAIADDRVRPLLVATTLAGVLLGPIVGADRSVFGVRGARARLDRLTAHSPA
jgi:hypothetical protein